MTEPMIWPFSKPPESDEILPGCLRWGGLDVGEVLGGGRSEGGKEENNCVEADGSGRWHEGFRLSDGAFVTRPPRNKVRKVFELNNLGSYFGMELVQ